MKRLFRENITIILSAVILWLLLKPPGCMRERETPAPDTTRVVTPVTRQGGGYAVKKSIPQSNVKKNKNIAVLDSSTYRGLDDTGLGKLSTVYLYSDSIIDLSAEVTGESLKLDYSIYCDSVTVTIRDTAFVPFTPASLRAGFIYTPGMAGPALFYDSGTIQGGVGIDAASRTLLFAMSVNVLTFERRKFRNDDRRRIKGKARRHW